MKKLIISIFVILLLLPGISFAASAFCNALYSAEGGAILSIGTSDYEVSFWMRQDGDPAAGVAVLGKGISTGGIASWWVVMNPTGSIGCQAEDISSVFGDFKFDATAFYDDAWHHYYFFADRSDETTSEIWIDGVQKTLTASSGPYPTADMTHGNFFTVGANSNGGTPFEGYIADVKVKIGGTMATTAQIEFQALNPWDYSSSAWNVSDGEREAYRLDEGSGTTAAAEVTSPTNDLTVTNVLIWNADGPVVATSSSQVIIITD